MRDSRADHLKGKGCEMNQEKIKEIERDFHIKKILLDQRTKERRRILAERARRWNQFFAWFNKKWRL